MTGKTSHYTCHFDNSPKRLAAYLKVQEEMKQLRLGAKANKRIGKQLKKA